jgi:hypothetical protein
MAVADYHTQKGFVSHRCDCGALSKTWRPKRHAIEVRMRRIGLAVVPAFLSAAEGST